MSKRMSERQLSSAIRELAEHLGWRCFAISNTKSATLRSHTGVGWPDLMLVRNGIAIAAKLKVGGRSTTKAQHDWLVALNEVPGILAKVWREKDWTSGEIENLLRQWE